MTFTGSENQNWGMLLQNHSDIPVHFYIMADPTIKSSIANFLRYKKYMVEGINISSAREMISAIQNDPNAMGFCRLSDMIGIDGKELAENISLVPIDKNGNGKLDYMEDIYGDLQTFSRGVWIGKYPPSLTGNIHLVSGTKPTNETAVAFLRWVVSDGQQYLSTSGFASLVNNEMLVQLDNLSGKPERIATPEKNNSATLKLILLILCTVLFVGFIVDYIISRLRSTSGSSNGSNIPYSVVFDEKSVNVPLGIYYDRSHTWAFMEKDGTVKLGIDDFLQHVTGPITRIDMKQAGERIKKGDLIFTLVQKGKQLNIHAPISGTITAQNKTLNTRTSALNATPYTDGWIYMVEPTNWLREIQFLSMAEKYRSWLKDEFLRLKDFFATVIYANEQEYAHVVIQDGGAIKDCILADLGPEVWDDFQTKFIDCPK
jgi:glycine cleavage system H lipoate-binding protein